MTFKNLRRLVAASFITAAAAQSAATATNAGETTTLTGVSGREVTLEVPVKHMILAKDVFCNQSAFLIRKTRCAGLQA